MTDTVDTVAAHRPYGLDCKCGKPINSDEDWARHLIDALQLTEERKTIPTIVGRIACTCGCTEATNEELHSCGYRKGHFEFHPSTRLVSPWKRAENQQ